MQLTKVILMLVAVPVFFSLVILGITKLIVPLLQDLSDKQFQAIDSHSTQHRPIGHFGKFAFVSFKVMIGLIIFNVFYKIYSSPLFLIAALKWEPPTILSTVLFIAALVFAGLTTYKLMQVVNTHFDKLHARPEDLND